MADEEQDENTFASCIWGYHVYQEFWTPTCTIGEILICQRQPSNIRDRYAVSVHNGSSEVEGHLARRLSRTFSLFLRHGGVVTCEVTGTRRCSTDLPQGGLEIPCLLWIEGKKKLISTLKNLIKRLWLTAQYTLIICDLWNYYIIHISFYSAL